VLEKGTIHDVCKGCQEKYAFDDGNEGSVHMSEFLC
jgi:hypothetical protein